MAGQAYILIGRRKTGKTTLSKKLIEAKPARMPVIVYDVNKEYTDIYPEPLLDFDDFLTKVSDERIRRHYILIEEATIFFNTQSNFKEMKNLLVRARHTGNIIQLNFHSFFSIPKGIYNLLDYVVIFKTNDSEKNVTDRFDHPKIIEAFRRARDSKNEFYNETVALY